MSYRVLVVDDTNFMRKMMADCLNQSGHVVAGEAANGREAIQMYEQLRPDFVVMDLTMPEMNGIDAIKEILAIHPKAVILVCSASNQQDMIFDAMEAGAKGYIMKPFNPKRLEEIIKKYAEPHINPTEPEEHPAEEIQSNQSEIVAETDTEIELETDTEIHVETDTAEEEQEPDTVQLVQTEEELESKPILLERGDKKMRSFVSSLLCNWQEEINGETTNYIVICTENENKLMIEVTGPSSEKQIVQFSIDGFRQLADWLEARLDKNTTNV
ncbi:response regulator [Cohnella kolymensis]|uniref:response regulator n=1 Tax=Cohnella kolymensis TaxID=1590652 RepID=UPI0009E4997C